MSLLLVAMPGAPFVASCYLALNKMLSWHMHEDREVLASLTELKEHDLQLPQTFQDVPGEALLAAPDILLPDPVQDDVMSVLKL